MVVVKKQRVQKRHSKADVRENAELAIE